jgi:radical SAM-linked protein
MQANVYKHRLKLTKLNELKFISHLDWQNLILKTLRRAGVDFVLSEGFNPTPKISFSPALPIFIESECEFVIFFTHTPIKPTFKEDFEKNSSKNVKLLNFSTYPQDAPKEPSLDNIIQWAQYEAKILNKNESISNLEKVRYNIENCLSKDDLFIEKINKKGIKKNINYKKSVRSLELQDDCIIFTLKTGQGDEIPSLRADEFLKTVFGNKHLFKIKRTHFFDKDLKKL